MKRTRGQRQDGSKWERRDRKSEKSHMSKKAPGTRVKRG